MSDLANGEVPVHLALSRKQLADRIAELKAKLDRVRGLPEKWREDEDACAAWEQWRNGAHCADELQSALGDEE